MIFFYLLWMALCCLYVATSSKTKSFSIFVALLIAPYIIFKFFQYGSYSADLPRTIEITYPISIGEEGDIMDGCAIAVFKLSESTIKNIETKGIRFFDGATHAQKQTYIAWKETPVSARWTGEDDDPGLLSCDVISSKLIGEIISSVKGKGAYYTASSERLLIVSPSLGYAVVVIPY